MISCREIRISAPGVRSLVWAGNELVDWAGGGTRFLLTGETIPRYVNYSYLFDAAVSSPSGEFAVIYTRRGTKGLVLRRGTIIREINRSFYCADAYEYPVTILRLTDGREVLVHSPDEYCRLEIEELDSGRRLTAEPSRKPSDFFHSRLSSSQDGLMLVSAGWIWHPVDAVHVFDVEAALRDPSHLDGAGIEIDAWADECSAAFHSDGRLVVVLNGIERDREDASETVKSPVEIRTFDLRDPRKPKIVGCTSRLGKLMSLGSEYLLGLYDFPRLIDAATGSELQKLEAYSFGSANKQHSVVRCAHSSHCAGLRWPKVRHSRRRRNYGADVWRRYLSRGAATRSSRRHDGRSLPLATSVAFY